MQKTAVGFLERSDPGTGFKVTNFGRLAASINFGVATTPPLGGLLFTDQTSADYALAVEAGSRPHWLPLEPMANYRQARMKKDGTPRKRKEEIKVPMMLLTWMHKRFPGIEPEQAVPFAFAIRGKISKVGTKGVFFFEKTRAAHEGNAAAVYEEFLDAAISRLEGGQ
jgi:hypothetical protein